jgi:glycosyltransferase involved in cell wall biosynthesis
MASISFVCPLYNKARLLPGVIAALARQAPGHDKQYIFVDDGSVDGSLDLVKQLTRDWPNCHYRRQENAGPSAATNAGFALAGGDYIKLLGSDDILAPYATDALLLALAETGAVAVYSEQAYYQTPDDIVFDNGPLAVRASLLPDPIAHAIKPGIMGTSMTLFRAAAVRAAGGCDERVFVEDYSLALRLTRLGGIAVLPLTTAYGPADDESRIMVSLHHQVLHDYTLSLALFLRQYPELQRRFGRLALRRTAGRAEKWIRREGNGEASPLPYTLLRLLSYLPLPGVDHVDRITATLAAFHVGPAPRAAPIMLRTTACEPTQSRPGG